MKNSTALIALSLLPLSLLAQTKPTAKKTTTATYSATNRVAKAPLKKLAPAPQYTAPQPATTANTAPAAAPVAQPQPTTVYAAPAAQPTATSRPAPAPQRVAVKANQSQSHFRVGFRVGGNSSTIGGTDLSTLGESVKLERVMGFHGGVMFNIGGPSFSIQPEILYTQYGIRLAAGSDYLQLKYNSVEVPVLLKASFGQPNLRFFINAGPVASYVVSGVVSVKEGGQSDSQKMELTNEGRLSFGASGGAGISLKAGPGAVQVEARYSYLFTTNDDGSKLTPQNAMLSVGYLIPLGGR